MVAAGRRPGPGAVPAKWRAYVAGTAYRHLEVTVGGSVARLTSNRPDRRNARFAEVLSEIGAGLADVAAGPATGLVLAANGPAFSAAVRQPLG